MRDGPRDAPREASHVGASGFLWEVEGKGDGASVVGEEKAEDREMGGAPDMYSSRKARRYSSAFHSFRKPRVPILNDRIGGTDAADAKSEEARRMVPSPPKVVITSTFSWRAFEGSLGE